MKDYAAIAASKIRKPRDRPLSILVYGRNKKGKTRYCTTAPNVLILDPEDGTDEFKQAAPDVWPIAKWEELDEVYHFLKSGKHNFEYVALDGMTRFANMALRFVMAQQEEFNLNRKPGLVQIQDYGKAGELVKGLMFNYHTLPMGKIYTAQERRYEDESKGYIEEDEDVDGSNVFVVPDLPAGARSSMNSIVDVIGRIYTVRKESEKTGKTLTLRRLWIAESAAFDTGYRSEHRLPDYIPNPTVPRTVSLIKNGTV